MSKKQKALWCVSSIAILAIAAYVIKSHYLSSEKSLPSVDSKETGDYLQKRGEALFKQHYYGAQIAVYQKMLEQFPENQDLKKKLAEAYHNADKEEESRKILDQK